MVVLLFVMSVQNLITQQLAKTIPKAVAEKTSDIFLNAQIQCSL